MGKWNVAKIKEEFIQKWKRKQPVSKILANFIQK